VAAGHTPNSSAFSLPGCIPQFINFQQVNVATAPFLLCVPNSLNRLSEQVPGHRSQSVTFGVFPFFFPEGTSLPSPPSSRPELAGEVGGPSCLQGCLPLSSNDKHPPP
jgi:hypothetical protein